MKKVKATPKIRKTYTRAVSFWRERFTLVYRTKICELWKEAEINNEKRSKTKKKDARKKAGSAQEV